MTEAADFASRPAVVLVQPRMPQNVGAVGRLCAATRSSLHVVRPIPFELSDRSLRRAGMDYLELLDWQTHDGWEEARTALRPRRLWYLSSQATRCLYEADLRVDDALVFGSEPAGLTTLLGDRLEHDQLLRIPMPEPEARCLNLATAVAIALYEQLRKGGEFRGTA